MQGNRPISHSILVRALPKAELYIHIEDTFEPEFIFEITRHNDVRIPYVDMDEVHATYDFHNLRSFLDIYYAATAVLPHEWDFYDLTCAYLLRCREDNVVRTEIFFDPQTYTVHGTAFEAVLNGVRRVCDDAHKEWGTNSVLVMCFLHHLSKGDTFETLTQAMPYQGHIISIGLDSSEVGHPPSKFQDVFAVARQADSLTVVHAGEEGPPEYVYGVLDLPKISRIDHGVRSEEDAVLIRRLIWEKMPLTVCPLSNLRLKVVGNLSEHDLRRMLRDGVLVAVNSNDPAYFSGYVNQDFIELAAALDLTENNIRVLCKNPFAASFLSSEEEATWCVAVDSCLT